MSEMKLIMENYRKLLKENSYLKDTEDTITSLGKAKRQKEFIESAPIRELEREYMDMGCGTGTIRQCKPTASACQPWTPEMCEMAKHRILRENPLTTI